MPTRVLNRIGFDPAGRYFLTAEPDGVILFRDAQTGAAVGASAGYTGDTTDTTLTGVAFRPDGDAAPDLWPRRPRPDLGPGDGPAGARAAAPRAATTWPRPSGPTGVGSRRPRVGEAEGRIRVWDAEVGRLVAESPRLVGSIYGLAFHPDGLTIAACVGDGEVRLFDAETGQTRGRPMADGGPVAHLAFSPDGRLLATGGDDGAVWIYDAATGRPLGTTPGHEGAIIGVIFRPDGRELVTAGRDGSARVWDTTPIADPGRGIPMSSAARAAEFSPDGRLLATDGVDGAARVFEVATGRAVLPPLVHAYGRVRFARFSPDGRLLATGGDDSVVRIWDVATGKPAGPPLPQPSWALNARFSPDGRRLLVGHTGGSRIALGRRRPAGGSAPGSSTPSRSGTRSRTWRSTARAGSR